MKRTKYTQLDSRIETDNIRCFILLSGLRKTKIKIKIKIKIKNKIKIKIKIKIKGN
jgi:hypothetical protein